MASLVLETASALGLALSILAYALIGLGVGASGTSLLALLATATAPRRRAAAATITWLMMIFGIAMTAGIVGQFLDPYTPRAADARSSPVVALAPSLLTCLAIWGIERGSWPHRRARDRRPSCDGLRRGLGRTARRATSRSSSSCR